MRARGFTLIELLISVALLALMMALLYSGLHVELRAVERGAAHADSREGAALGARFLRRELAQALPILVRDGGRTRIEFSGGESELRFAGVAPPHRGVPGVYRVTLRVEPARQGLRLALYYQLLPADPGVAAEAEATAVFDALSAGRFSYFGESRERTQPQWLDHWTDAMRAPLLVRFEYSDAAGTHAVIAPVRTALRVPSHERSDLGRPLADSS